MARTLETLIVEIDGDDSNLNRTYRRVEGSTSRLGNSFMRLGTIIASAFAVRAVADFGSSLIRAASDAEELQNRYDVVFRGITDEVNEWAANYADAVGRSEIATRGFLADQQDILTGLGLNTREAAELSKNIVSLGIDLGSFQNLSDEDALRRLGSALRGSSEAAAGFGADISVATLQQSRFFQELGRGFNELTQLEKIQLRLNVITEQSANALGDAERSSGSFANQLRRLQGSLADSRAELGARFLPIATRFLVFLNESLPRIQEFGASAVESFGRVFNVITNAFEPVFSTITRVLGTVLPLFRQVGELLTNFVLTRFQAVAQVINNVFIPAYEAILDIVGPVIEALVERLEAFNELFVGIFEGSTQDALSNFRQFFLDTIEDIFGSDSVQAAEEFIDGFIRTVSAFISNLRTFFTEARRIILDFSRNVIGNLRDVIEELRPIFEPIFEAIGSVLVELLPILGEIIIGFAEFLRVAIPAIQEIVGAIIRFLLPVLRQIGESLGELFRNAAPILRQLFELFSRLAEIIVDVLEASRPVFAVLGALLAGLLVVITGVINGTLQALGPLISALLSLVNTVVDIVATIVNLLTLDFQGALDSFLSALENFGRFVFGIFETIGATIDGFISGIDSALRGFGIDIGAFFRDFLGRAISAIFNFLRSIVDFVSSAVSGIARNITNAFTGIRDFLGNILNGIANIFTSVWTSIVDFVSGAIDAIANTITGVFTSIRDFFSNILNEIVGFFQDFDLFQIGKDLIQGFIDGVVSLGRAIFDAITGPIRSAVDFVKGLLGIASPSRVFRQIGRDTARGLELGLQDGTEAVEDSAINLANRVIDPAQTVSSNVTENNIQNNRNNSQTFNFFLDEVTPSRIINRATKESELLALEQG